MAEFNDAAAAAIGELWRDVRTHVPPPYLSIVP